MKKRYFSLSLCCFSLLSFGQIVNIPDANFKAKLLEANALNEIAMDINDASIQIDANNNNEIEISEAQAVFVLSITGSSISDLTGIEFFTNLRALACHENNLTELPISNLSQLHDLYCFSNPLSSLTSIENLTSLRTLEFGGNTNTFTSVNLQNLSNLRSLDFSSTLLTSIDLCGTAVTWLWCPNNPNLQFISVKNNTISPANRPAGNSNVPPALPNFYFENLPSLSTICYDESELAAVQQSSYGPTTPQLTIDCGSNCDGNQNIVTGTIKYDSENNGCSSSNFGVGLPIVVTQFGEPISMIFSRSSGLYSLFTFEDNLTLTPQIQNPYFTINPVSANTTYSGFGNTETIDFCVQTNGSHADLEIVVLPMNPARPGFDAKYKIVYQNNGNLTQSGTITMNFDDPILDFVTANPAVNSQVAGSLTWNFSDLVPFESRAIEITLNANSPQESPALNNGAILAFSSTISGILPDETPNDNISILNQVVVGSFDPNDKLVLEGSVIDFAKVDEYLHYVIRFQNTGTASAEKVVITDFLADNLDMTSLQMVASSHPYRSILKNGNLLQFDLENINLPPVSIDEAGSNGFVAFKIKPASTVVIGTEIENTASIYFDFNFPIVTNTTSTTFENLLTTDNFTSNPFTLHPNPTKNTVNIGISTGVSILSIAIYNPLGQLVKTLAASELSSSLSFDVSTLKTGTYFLEIESNNGKTTKKFVKL